MAPSAKSWADLPGDLLVSIARRLDDDPLDLIRYGAVCTSWSSAIDKSMIPWLIKGPGSLSTSFCFFRPVDKNTYRIPLPGSADADVAVDDSHVFFRSSLGYLIFVDRDANLHVTNPITRVHHALPPTHTFPGIRIGRRDPLTGHPTSFAKSYKMFDGDLSMSVDGRTFRSTYFRKVAVSPKSSWAASTPIVAASVHGFKVTLAIARPGDASWTPLPGFSDPCCIIFHGGRLFATTLNDDVTLVYDPARPADMPMQLKDAGYKLAPDHHRVIEARYLVESLDGEELFLVIRRTDYSRSRRRTRAFMVYRLVMLTRTDWTWLYVDNLGDLTILFGLSLLSNCSVLVSSSECEPHLAVERNCIYFLDDGEDDLAVFHLEDGSISYHSPFCGQWTPRWFTPLLL